MYVCRQSINNFLFAGILALPNFQSGLRHRMARVTIDFFRLNIRDRPREERAKGIVELTIALQLRGGSTGATRQLAVDSIERLTSEGESHTRCGRAYRALFENDRSVADQHLQAARDFLDSIDSP